MTRKICAHYLYNKFVLHDMSAELRHHFKWDETRTSILEHILTSDNLVNEPEVRKKLQDKYGENKKSGEFDRSTINKHLHKLVKDGCIESIKNPKEGKFKFYDVKTPKNLENIIKEFPEFVELLQNSDFALNIVLDALTKTLAHFIKPEFKEIDAVKQYIAPIREDLRTKLKMSASFFKLCITPEYNMYRNLSDLSEISDGGPHAHIFVIDDVPSVFVKSAVGADVAFKACVAIEIISRPANSRKDMKKKIEYVKEMKNQVSETQLNNLKKYYEKLKNEADILKQIENTDPDKQLECLKQHYKKLLKAPHFLQSKKFVPVDNLELCKLEKNFQNDDDDAWDYLDDKETEGPA